MFFKNIFNTTILRSHDNSVFYDTQIIITFLSITEKKTFDQINQVGYIFSEKRFLKPISPLRMHPKHSKHYVIQPK